MSVLSEGMKMRLLGTINSTKVFFFLLLPFAMGLPIDSSCGQIIQEGDQSNFKVMPASFMKRLEQVTLPSPLVQWTNHLGSEGLPELLSNDPITSIILEVRTITFPSDQELTLSSFFKPGTFEVVTGASPIKQATLTNQGEVPVPSIKIDGTGTSTKVAAAIRSTQTSKPVALAKLNETGLKELLKQVKGKADVGLAELPTTSAGLECSIDISDVAMRPFVVGVKNVRLDGSRGMKPIIQLIEDGLTLRIKPSLDDGGIRLLADVASTQVTDVKEFFFPQYSKKNPESGVAIQIPEVTSDTVHLDTMLENNETLFVDAMLTRSQVVSTKANRFARTKTKTIEKRIFLLVTAHVNTQHTVVEHVSK